MSILLLYSVPVEGRSINKHLENKRQISSTCLSGKLFSKNIIAVQTGIGKTNAAHSVTTSIEKYSPDLIISFGIGGAYPHSGIQPGDIAIAESEIYGDEGLLLRDGFHTMDKIGIPVLKKGRKKYFNEFIIDKKLVKKAYNIISAHASNNIKCRAGTFITVSTCTGTIKRANELSKRFNAICENMEGAAIAHVCTIYSIPFIEIRGISNQVEDRDKTRWDIRLASENCQEAIIKTIKYL